MAIHLRQRGNTWHARGTIFADGVKITVPEFSTRYRDREQAERYVAEWEIRRLAELLDEQRRDRIGADTFRETGRSEKLPAWAQLLWRNARTMAAKRAIHFDLGEQEMAALVARAGGHCEVSGLPFSNERPSGMRRPFAPSIDRITSAQGYVFGNCRLVCCAVNLAMNEWGLDVLLTVARAVTEKHRPMGKRVRAGAF